MPISTTTIIISVIIILTTLLTLYTIYLPPHRLIEYFSRRWPDILWYIDLDISSKTTLTPENNEISRHNIPTYESPREVEKIIALTIDDSPSSRVTRQIRDILKAYNAHATFFVIGSHMLHHNNNPQSLSQSPSQNRSEEATAILADLVSDGNELANHAMFD
jgi:peptidoglycan/xylan/chitin deacetylase (PgdA/CDA1 family)